MSTIWWISALLGLAAGGLTTVAGMGGGTLLVLALAAVGDPLEALVVSSPALLAGNLHRLWQDRAHVDRALARRVVPWALLGAFGGGLLAVGLPPALLAAGMFIMALGASARLLGLELRPPLASAGPVSALAGVVSATTGGGGLMMGPLLLSLGQRGVGYVATGAASAIAIHVGRNLAYGLGGAMAPELALRALVLAGGIAVGNQLGRRLRHRLAPEGLDRLQHAVMLGCVALGAAGALT